MQRSFAPATTILFLCALFTVVVGSVRGEEAEPAGTAISDDWLAVDSAGCKLFLPGQWSYTATSDDVGTNVTARFGDGTLEMTIQSIEGKKEATPEGLEKIFSEHIAGTRALETSTTEKGLHARYIAVYDGETTLLKALFARSGDTAWMVYGRVVMADAQEAPQLEKLMDSVLGSFASTR